MEIEVVRPSALAASDLAAWAQLQAADPALDSPFLAPGWALAVERARDGRPGQVVVAVLREADAACGFLPARVGGLTAMPAGAPMEDYQGLVAASGLVIDPRSLLKPLGVHRLDFTHMRADQPAFAAHLRAREVSYVIDAANGYDAYQAERREAGSGIIKDIDKRRRKVEREVGPVTFEALSADAEAFEQLLTWKRAQLAATGQTDIFAAGWTERLVRELFAAPAEGFRGALFTLRIGGQLAAVHFHLPGRRVLHAWLIAHDEAFERYSPGLLLFQDILRWMGGAGFTSLDLGAGEYRFKLQLSNARREIGHGFVGRPSPFCLLREAQYGLRQTAERLPLGQVSHLPGKAMRRLDQWRGLR